MNKLEKRNLTEINILRGLLCLFVLTIHASATPSVSLQSMSISSVFFSILNIGTKVAVPGFIFISGLVLSYGYREKEKINLLKFYLKRIKGIILPYIIFTALYYMIYIIKFNYEVSWNFFLGHLIKGTMVYHLYYIIINIQFDVLFPIIHRLFKKFNHNFILISSIMINLLCVGHINSSTSFLKYLMFFILGSYIGFNYEKTEKELIKKENRNYIIFGGISISIFYIVEQYLNRNFATPVSSISWYLFSFVTIIFYLLLCKLIEKNKNKFISKIKNCLMDISKVSFSIYLIHPLVLLYLESNFNNLSISLKYSLIYSILIISSIIYAKITKRLKSKKVNS